MKKPASRFPAVLCLLWPALWLGGLFFLWPLSLGIATEQHGDLIFWASRRVWAGRWLWIAANAMSTLALTAFIWRKSSSMPAGARILTRSLLPVTLLALLFVCLIMKDVWPRKFVANTLFYLPLFAFSLPLSVLSEIGLQKKRSREKALWPRIVMITAAGTALFWTAGMAHTHWCGEHAGDEGHYIIQAKSLYEDGDLDIRNQFETAFGENIKRYEKPHAAERILHISPASRHGRWYSYHTPGIAFLTFWTIPLGYWARHLVLGLIGGLAISGAYLLCRLAGAREQASVTVAALYALSIYAVTYASRFLPEMLGAALTTWMLAAAVLQKRHPLKAVLLATGAVSMLPWGHLRFLPAALAGAAFFAIYGLFVTEKWKPKIIRLTLFSVLVIAGLLFYRVAQLHFFEDGFSHPVGRMLMSFPKGITRVFTDHRGLAHILPLIVWMVPCGLLGFILPSRNKALTAGAAFVFAVTWILSCSARNYGGGATLGGRFLVAVVPLLLPATALFWERTSPVMRWWLLLLGLVSIGLGIIQLSALPALGRNFAMPFQTIPMVRLPLWGWHLPWPGAGFIMTVAAVHALWMLCPALQRRPAPWMLGCLLAANIAMQTGREGLPASEPLLGKRHAAQQLSRLDLERAFMDPAKTLENLDLFAVSNMLLDRRDTFRALRVTTEKLGSMHASGVISQPRVDINDWKGRDLRWVTLHHPFSPGAGLFAFKIAGSVSGAATVRLALREGSRTILETPLKPDATGNIAFSRFFEVQSSRGLLYILIHLENEGETSIDFLGLSPCGPALKPFAVQP